jgi:Tol biopolymer transport system component
VAARTNAQVSQDVLLFLRDQFLMAQRFDPKTIELIGDPFPVAETVQYEANFFAGAFSVSTNGILVFRTGSAASRSLLLVDEKGEILKEVGPPAQYDRVRVSPEGRRVAVTLVDGASGNEDVWVFDIERGTKTRVSFGEAPDKNPVWSPDGTRIAYQSASTGNGDIYVRSSSGSGAETLLYSSEALDDPESWSHDGKYIFFNKVESNKTDLWLLEVETGEARPVITGEFEEGWGYLSPDGKWLAYLSNESGPWQAYVVRFPDVSNGRWQISTETADWLIGWRDDGRVFYYMDAEGYIVRVELDTGDTLEAGTPEKLFRAESNMTWSSFGDGKSFVVGRSPEKLEATPITMVVDWLPEESRRDK